MPKLQLRPPAGQGGGTLGPAIPEDEIVYVTVEECNWEELPQRFLDPEKPHNTHRISFKFRVTEGEYEKRVIWGNTSTWFSSDPRCKLRLWAKEILGIDIFPADYELDTDDLVGKEARVLVGNREKQDGTTTHFAKDILRMNVPSYSTAPGPLEEPF
jgi:hypothetical protein